MIKDLNIVNAFSCFEGSSPIVWKGNNGILSNCTFQDTRAPVGGAVRWMGDNGLIDNVAFVNCTAQNLAGALYINGSNNVVNALCLGSDSSFSGEAIYADKNSKNTTLNSYYDNKDFFVIDGKYTNIDVSTYNNLHYSYPIVGEIVDLMPLLYKTFTIGGVNPLNENTLYSGWYVNSSEFVWTFTRNFDNGVTYQKNFYFHDVNTTDDIFWTLYNSKFDYDHRLVKEITISNIAEYESTCKLIGNKNIFSSEIETLFGQEDSLVKTLDINFAGKYVFESHSLWNLSNPNIDVINIKGNGSTISGNSGDRDTYKWALISGDKSLSVSNLTVKRFNTAIENLGGTCFLNNVTISDNKMDYLIERDWGAGILNVGTIYCTGCTFSNNYAKNGGAIFSQGTVVLYDTTFIGNTAYNSDSTINHKGNDICVGDGGKVQIDGENITSDTSHVFFAKSISSTTETVTKVATIVGFFVAGFVVGVVSFNPVLGFVAGAAAGAGIGAVGARLIISKKFDISYNRLKTCLILIIGGAVSGGLGGLAGYYATAAGTSTQSAAGAAQSASSQSAAGAAQSSSSQSVANMGTISVNQISNQGQVQFVAHLAGHAEQPLSCCIRVLL